MHAMEWLSRARLTRWAVAALLSALFLLPGCSLFYRHHLEYDDFSLYGNQSKPTLERTGDTIQRTFDAYREIFPSLRDRVGGARVLYEEDALSQERIFTGELRQEGFYLPALDLIHLSPRRPRGDADDLAVILHEMAHHFLISGYPRTSSRYWLNEGLACSLEVSYFDPEGRLVSPMFHLGLFTQARRLLRENGEEDFRQEVESLLDASWFRFHHSDEKNHHYAYSWCLFWQLFRTREGSIDERVRQIVSLSPEELRTGIDELVSVLASGADRHLAEIAKNDPTLRGWCLDRWVELPWPNASLFLEPLLAELAPESGISPETWARAARLANSSGRGMRRGERLRLNERVAKTLADPNESVEVRLAIAEAISEEGSRYQVYIGPLIEALEDSDGKIRASSAKALARLSRQKPTVVNPGFWQNAPEPARAAEVDEWRRWWRRWGGPDRR